MYRLFVHAPDEDVHPSWHDSEEGPWGSYDNALFFALREVGVPWAIVNEEGHPVAYGDSMGMMGGPEPQRKVEP